MEATLELKVIVAARSVIIIIIITTIITIIVIIIMSHVTCIMGIDSRVQKYHFTEESREFDLFLDQTGLTSFFEPFLCSECVFVT